MAALPRWSARRLSTHISRHGFRPSTRSFLKITNRSFGDAAPCLWNELTTDLREPCQIQSPLLSPITHGSSPSSSSPSSLSPIASSLTRPVFHFELKTWLFGKSKVIFSTNMEHGTVCQSTCETLNYHSNNSGCHSRHIFTSIYSVTDSCSAE